MGIWKGWMGNRNARRKGRGSVSVPSQGESLEVRCLLSAGSLAQPSVKRVTSTSFAGPQSVGYTPEQIRAAYGFEGLVFGATPADGRGQTIAIIDAYDHPFIESNLATFNAAFGLPDPPSFTVVNQNGGTKLPKTDPRKIWEGEIALDVEWAHAIAPGADILLVEANSNSDSDLFAAVDYARHVPGVSVISMSWGSDDKARNASYDQPLAAKYLVTPPGHQGITFVVSTGDHGVPSFPATSPGVLAVGGTNLHLNSDNTIRQETAWLPETDRSGTWSGGGGVSEEFVGRTVPDVSYNGGVSVAVYDTFGPDHGWIGLEGTSAGAPQWAALIAIANQGRVINGLGTLNGANETLQALYSAPTDHFHDITIGSTEFEDAGPGYDLATGLGSPAADKLIPYLAAYNSPPITSLNAPTNLQATPLSPSSAQLTWDPVADAIGYRIFRVADGKLSLLQAVNGSTTSTTLTGLPAGANVTLIVEAFAGSLSAQSAHEDVSLPAPPPDPLVLSGKVKSARSVKLQWNPITTASEYRIFSDETTPVLVTTLSSGKSKTRVNNLEPGATVEFRVEAAIGSGVVDSNWISLTTTNKNQAHVIPESGRGESGLGQTLRTSRKLSKR
ncbi:MAG: fibronectin type III domain-containing protein [Planctomycetales bacterium]